MTDDSFFSSSVFTALAPGIALCCVGIAIAGVGKALSNCAEGICSASEIKVDVTSCIIPTSMIGAGLILALIIAFKLAKENVTDLVKGGKSIAACLVGCLGIYYGCMAMSAIAKYGVGTRIRQKAFKSVFLIILVVGELVSIFGLILFFVISQ